MKKTIILGVCGGVAAYKAVELARLLIKNNFIVRVVMTNAAMKFITPLTFQAVTNNPVLTDQEFWNNQSGNGMDHINLSRDADLILVAPASANFLAKLNSGICDDLLTNICAARSCDLIVCPAMNSFMYHNPPNLKNIDSLKNNGVFFIGPELGIQACGENGMGRLSEPISIFNEIEKYFSQPLLKNLKILISAGATIEKIDAARAITNFSSGKMGVSIANEAFQLGADVTLVKGITHQGINPGIRIIEARNHDDMETVIYQEAKKNNIFISVAAISDYKAKQIFHGKIKKDKKLLTLELEKTNDILKNTKKKFPNLFCVGFAAESNDLIHYAKQKLIEKNLDMVIANELNNTMGHDDAEVIILDKFQEKILPRMPKIKLANNILLEIQESYQKNEN